MLSQLAAFLARAKRNGGASHADRTAAPPALAGSRRLEYRAGRFTYHDVHFGMARIAGQETVSYDERVIWSMVYAGGVLRGVADEAEIAVTYDCLCQALRMVEVERPFRGPRALGVGTFHYLDESTGDVASFHGTERILRDGATVYRLDYNGGLIR
jgi:Domain of unknown function (DUF5680)